MEHFNHTEEVPLERVAIFIKTYAPDANLVTRLLSSIKRYNVDRIKVILSVPDEEISIFLERLGSFDAMLIADSFFGVPEVSERLHGQRPGYISQQMIKLSVHKLNFSQSYVVLDSDAFFIKNFTELDFVSPEGEGYTVMVHDKEQLCAPWYSEHIEYRSRAIDIIGDYFNLPPPLRATCHGNAILRSDVLSNLETWRIGKGLTLLDLMRVSALEYSWYSFYMRKYQPESIIQIEPFIRYIHSRGEYRALLHQGYSITELSRAYVGLCPNTTWAGKSQRAISRRLKKGSRVAAVMSRYYRVVDNLIDTIHRVANKLLR